MENITSSIRCKCFLIKQLIIKWGIFFFPHRISEGQSVCCTHKSNIQPSFRGELRGQGQRRRAGTDVAAAVGPQDPPQNTSTAKRKSLSSRWASQGHTGKGKCWIPKFFPLLPQIRQSSPGERFRRLHREGHRHAVGGPHYATSHRRVTCANYHNPAGVDQLWERS